MYNSGIMDGTLVAAEDLSTYQFCFVKLANDNSGVVVCGDGDRAYGILQNKPTLGQACEIVTLAGSYLKMGAVCAQNQALTSDANGCGTPCGVGGDSGSGGLTGDFANATAKQTCSSAGEIISVWVSPLGIIPIGKQL